MRVSSDPEALSPHGFSRPQESPCMFTGFQKRALAGDAGALVIQVLSNLTLFQAQPSLLC